MNVTKVPEQIVVADATMLTLAGRFGFMVIAPDTLLFDEQPFEFDTTQ